MRMHIGAPARAVVRAGDKVSVGSLVGKADGAVSANIHSSVSGIVTEICELTLQRGVKTKAIRIASDGENRRSESLSPPEIKSKDDFVRAIRQSGIVGLGGAGFPTHVKYDVDADRAECLIVNAAECEPYITSDTCTFSLRSDDVKRAFEAISEFYAVKRIIIGVEKGNKRASLAAKSLEAKCERVEAVLLGDVYPQGAERVLIYHVTGKVVPTGCLPIDSGCIVSNVSTLAEIGRYLKDGVPLVERCITVDGGAVREAQNVIVPVGVRAHEVFEFCGGFCEKPPLLLYGGPMMGVLQKDVSVPVMKNTNALLALSLAEASVDPTTSCIRCGSCFRSCPFDIDPAAVARAYKRGAAESVRILRIDACMECGCCAYACPAKLPLVESNRLAKQMLKKA